MDGPWPDEIDVTTELLGHTNAGVRGMRREGLRLYFDLVNTHAEYVITGYDRERLTVRAARLYCQTWDAPAVEALGEHGRAPHTPYESVGGVAPEPVGHHDFASYGVPEPKEP